MADEKNIPLYVDPQILARDLDNSLSLASRSTTTPDDEAQLREASRRLGIPLDSARTNPAATKQALERDSFDASDFATRFPSSAVFLANPENAAVSRDDVAPLSEVEKALRRQVDVNQFGGDMSPTERLMPGFAAEKNAEREMLRTEGFAAASALKRQNEIKRAAAQVTGTIGAIQQPEATPGNILSGLGTSATTGFKSARLGLLQQFGDLFNDDEGRNAQSNRARSQLDFERDLATPQFDTDVARWTYGGFSSLAQTAPALALSIGTGSTALGLGLMGAQTYGEAYGRYRGRGAKRGEASLGASGEASVEVLTEILPMKFAVDRLGKAGLTKFLSGFLARDMAGEQIATLAQDALDTAIANPTKTWSDYMAERPEAAIQTAFASLVQSGTLAAIGEGAGRLAGTLDRNQANASAATEGADQLDQLMAAAAASMTRQRDPQSFAQLVQEAADDSGAAPSELFIDAKVLAGLLEGAGMTPEQLAQSLPSVQEQLEEALATDGAIAIPIGEATAAFAGSGLEQQFVQNARISESAWSAAEAKEGSDLLAQLEQDAQKVLAEQTEAQAWQDSSNAVFDTLMAELGGAKRFAPDVNRAYATLVRNFYAVQAGKLGITPQEMYAQFPLTVSSRAPGRTDSNTLSQAIPVEDLKAQMATEFPGLKLDLMGKGATVTLSRIVVPEDGRQQGVGTQVMERLIHWADQTGKAIALTPSADFGGNKKRLTEFYKRFGFVENKGKNKDYEISESMYRPAPVLNQEGTVQEGARVREDGTDATVTGGGLTLLHGAPRADMDWNQVEIVRATGQKQGKKGRVYGGFYATSQQDIDQAQGYAEMAEGTPTIYDVRVKEGTKVLNKEGDVTRLSENYISQLVEQGYGLVVGKDPRGRTEYVVINKDAVESFAPRGAAQAQPEGKVGQQRSGARATFNPGTLNITLLEKADLSSFLHETGHFFFEMQAELAARPDAPASIVADMETLLAHVGYVGTPSEWLAQPLEARREAHETIAETFEEYLFTGKAPNAEMQAIFRRFRSWLVSVYRSLQQMLAINERASLNPDVAAVFDRMIATEDAIAAAQAQRAFEPMFNTAEEAGMDEAAWANYRSNIDQQQADALDEVQARTLRDLKWLDNAKGRKLKELQKAAAAQRKAVRDEVTAEVNAMPIYRAMEFLKYGKIESDGQEIQIEITKAAKLNITDLQTMYPEGELGTGAEWRKLGYGKYGMLSDAGLHPDNVAEIFGFRSGRLLVKDLLNAEPKTSVIEGMTDQRMLERHGDIASPEAMMEAANEALANDARARMVATELKAVAKATGSVSMLVRAARQAAEQMIAAKPVRNLRPDLAAASAARARKAAEAAMAKGDTAAAAAAKRTEILQIQLERAQRVAQKEHDKALAGFKKIFKGTNEKLAKSRDLSMVNAARAVLARYGLAPNTGAANAQAYMELLANYDGAMAADIKSILQGLPPSTDFRDLTVEQFRGMRDVVNGLYYLSRRTRQMEIDGQKVEIDAVADELVATVTELSGGEIPALPGYASTPTGLDKWKASISSAKGALMRVEFWADRMGAPFKKYIWQPVSEATADMRMKRNDLIRKYRDLLKTVEKGITYNKIDAPELGAVGFTFNAGKTELLHAVLHSGNQSNLTKLLLGRGWGSLDANGRLDTAQWDQFITRMIDEGVLTKADFDFAQGVWDLLETVKVDAQAAHKEMYGYYFNEVTADPINTPFGQYRGGYVPALADSLSSPDMAQKREQEELLHAGNSFMFPTTGKGFTQSRVMYNKPLELDLRTIGRHLDKVARFAYLEPAVRDVMQLIGNKRVARALNGANPGAISDMLMPWLQRSATQSASMPGKNPKVNKFFNGLRSRAGMVFMFGNVVNTLQQVTGFSLAALKVPAPKLLRATYRSITDRKAMVEFARSQSPWLVERMDNQSFMMQSQIEEILTNANAYEKTVEFAKMHAYFLQQAAQNVMDPIVWTGAYDHALSKGVSEKDAARYANEAVRTTQGSFAPEDIAGFEMQSPFVRLFTQFYGYFNMWGNLIGSEANKAVREMGFAKASPRLMFIWFAGMAIPAFVAELIARGLPDDEDDEDGDGLLDEWLAMFFGSQAKSAAAMVPGVGHLAVLGANMLDDKVYNDRLSISPALSALESGVKGAVSAADGTLFDEEVTKSEVRNILTMIGLAFGLPVAPVARAGGYAADVANERVEPEGVTDVAIGIVTGR